MQAKWFRQRLLCSSNNILQHKKKCSSNTTEVYSIFLSSKFLLIGSDILQFSSFTLRTSASIHHKDGWSPATDGGQGGS